MSSPAVRRAAALLTDLAGYPDGSSAPDLARRLGYAKSSTVDLVSTLIGEEALTRDSDGTVRLGQVFTRLARGFVEGTDAAETFTVHANRIDALTGRTVSLAARIDDDLVYLAVRHGDHPTHLTLAPGLRLPLWDGSAAGVALLATESDGAIQSLLSRTSDQWPPTTSPSRANLMDAVRQCRDEGYAESLKPAGDVAVVAQLGATALTVATTGIPAPRATDLAATRELADLVAHSATR